jgi:hypothetical protein
MAEIRIYLQPKFPSAVSRSAFYDFSKHVEFDTLEWEQNDQGNASSLRANIYSIMPVSETRWYDYAGATEAIKIQAALDDPFYHLKVYPRTEIQVRDVSTSPHTILWGGVVTRVSEQKDGGAIVGSIEAIDYTALLNESVALEYTPIANSTIKQTITSQTYSFTPSLASRVAGFSSITVDAIAIGSPYSRSLEPGDTIVVNLSDDTYDGVHKVTGVTGSGPYIIRFQQYSNVADSVSASVTGSVAIPGFMTTANAPQLDPRVRVLSSNISDINPDWKWSPRNPDISRAISTASRTAASATITTSAPHGFGVDRVVTIALTNGPSGYTDLNGSYLITAVPTDSTFTYTTSTTGTITSGAAVGNATCAGEITPTPMKGGTLARNLSYAVERGTGVFYLNAGVLDGAGALTIDLFVRPKNLNDLVSNGLFEAGSSTGWTLGSWLTDAVGNTGPYGAGNTIYYTGSDHQDAEMAPESRITVAEGERYFVSWRHYSDKDAKEKPRMKFYDAGGSVVGNPHGVPISQTGPIDDEWHRDWGIVIVPANAVKMSFTLHHEEFASSYTARFTDIQIIKITGAFGFSDHPLTDTTIYGMPLKDFENPNAPQESGEYSNRIYVYAPYTNEDPLTGAKQLTSYRNTYDFVQGVWEAGGKRIEGSIVELNATDSATALLTAQKYFKERGSSLKSFEFQHISGSLNVGDVIPFIWTELGIAEALVVRKQVGYLIGQDVYYRVQLGGDLAFQRSTMYLVEQRLREISGDAAYFSPPPSPYPGYPTEGGIVTPAIPTGNAGANKVDLSWEYPQSIINGTSFGGFVILRSGDAGDNWVKASTGEAILTAQNPLAPDSAVPSYSDTNVTAGIEYIYKVAAVDVSGQSPILTQYSADSEGLTPTSVDVDFDDAYNGLGINVPKIVNSVTYPGNGVAKTISTITSSASTTATVTTSTAHGFSNGWVVGITGAVGTNNADVNGGFYSITVTSSTQFTIIKTGTNTLSLTQGTANGWQVSGDYIDDDATSRSLGDAFSLLQFPVGQLAYSEFDGKLYRNGKPGTTAFDNKWTRAAVDAIDVTSDGSITITADRITTGTLNAGNVSVTNLNASNITTGTLTSRAISNGAFTVSSAGAVNASDLTITGGSISLNGGVFGVTSLGAVTASNMTITGGSMNINGNFIVNSSGDLTAFAARFNPEGKPAVTLQGNSDEGDIAVPDGNRLDIGHTNTTTNAFDLSARMSPAGNWTFSNDVTINGTLTAAVGSFSVADGSITAAKLAADSVTTSKIVASAITATEIAAGAVGSSEIATGAVGSDEIAASAVTTSKIAASAVTSAELGSAAVTNDKIAALAVGTAELIDLSVTQAKIAADAVTNSKINDGAVQSNSLGTNAVVYGKVADGAIGTASIIDLAVTTEKLAADSVTTAKINAAAVGQTELSLTAIFKSSTIPTDVTTSNRAAVWSGTGATAALRRSSGSVTSERAFKKNIQNISTETDKYASLNWISFKYDVEGMQNYGLASAGVDYEVDDVVNWGLIADEVQALFPEAVVTENSEGVSYRGIKYEALRAIEGTVIKDLIGRVKSLEARVAELENK